MTTCKRLTAARRGFTLVEIMLVVVIIGILASMVVVNLGGMAGDARESRVQADIAKIRMAVGLFEQKYGHYPTEEEGGLKALYERPSTIPEEKWRRFGETKAVDPWGNPYVYLVDSRRIDRDRDYNLFSMGPNGMDDRMQEDDLK